MNGYGKSTKAYGSMYVGYFQNGKKNGKGVAIELDGIKMEGTWKDDDRNGKFKDIWPSGAVSECFFVNAKREGEGIFYSENGEVFKNKYLHDKQISSELIKTNYFYFGKPKVDLNRWKKITYNQGGEYEGELKGNKRNGFGYYFFSNGDIYCGYWKNDQKEGKGSFFYADGKQYAGEFKNDKRNGKGILFLTDGSFLNGDWKDDQLCGKAGCYNAKDNTAYRGDVVNGVRNGFGCLSYNKDGAEYIGQWKNGKRCGKGYYLDNNFEYFGEWENDQPHGKGKAYLKDGSLFIGTMKNGCMSKGTIFYSYGKFEGEFDDNGKKKHGIEIYLNGNSYEGDFVNNNKHGHGTYIVKGEYKYVGEFVNDKEEGYGKIEYFNGRPSYEGQFIHGTRKDVYDAIMEIDIPDPI